MLEQNKKIILKSFVLAFANCYVMLYNCYEMLKICRDWFGKSLSTVVFIGNIAVTVPHPCLLLFCLTIMKSIYSPVLSPFFFALRCAPGD